LSGQSYPDLSLTGDSKFEHRSACSPETGITTRYSRVYGNNVPRETRSGKRRINPCEGIAISERSYTVYNMAWPWRTRRDNISLRKTGRHRYPPRWSSRIRMCVCVYIFVCVCIFLCVCANTTATVNKPSVIHRHSSRGQQSVHVCVCACINCIYAIRTRGNG